MAYNTENKVKVAIIGASGYSGEELVRLLLKHPFVEISRITSRQYAGQSIAEVFPRFADAGLSFCQPDVKDIAENCDAVFLALPHGLATEFAIPLLEAGLKVIDVSADFRLKSTDKYLEYYNEEHPAPALLKTSVYGQPERYREQVKDASLIACPGCYPTSIVLPVAPLLRDGLVETTNIISSSMSGVTGAGRKVALPFIFPEANESVKPYGITGHRHLPEIEQELASEAGVEEIKINFTPHLVPINRGIHSTIFLDAKPGVTEEDIEKSLNNAYDCERFVRILPKGKLADTKHITLTNVCEVGFALDKHTGKVILSSAIDNLTRGASGQAVQCFNLIFDFPEETAIKDV
mgnify:CR=1 FL=1